MVTQGGNLCLLRCYCNHVREPFTVDENKVGQTLRKSCGSTRDGRGTSVRNSVSSFCGKAGITGKGSEVFFNVEHEDQSKLVVAKLVVQRLEEEIAKLKEVEIVPYLIDVRKLLIEKSSPGRGKTRQNRFLLILNLPPYQAKSQFINC